VVFFFFAAATSFSPGGRIMSCGSHPLARVLDLVTSPSPSPPSSPSQDRLFFPFPHIFFFHRVTCEFIALFLPPPSPPVGLVLPLWLSRSRTLLLYLVGALEIIQDVFPSVLLSSVPIGFLLHVFRFPFLNRGLANNRPSSDFFDAPLHCCSVGIAWRLGIFRSQPTLLYSPPLRNYPVASRGPVFFSFLPPGECRNSSSTSHQALVENAFRTVFFCLFSGSRIFTFSLFLNPGWSSL